MADDLNGKPQIAAEPRPDPQPAPQPRPRPYAGTIDALVGGQLYGWAVDPDGAPCEVTIFIDDRPVGTTVSDIPRGDVAEAGMSAGLGGWRFLLGGRLPPGEHQIDARFPNGTKLRNPLTTSGSDNALPQLGDGGARLTYVGAIDRSAPPTLSGWALSSRFEAADVIVTIGDQAPITLASRDPRPDLAEQKLSPGDGGWHLDVDALVGGRDVEVSICFPDGGHLPGSPFLIRQPGSTGEAPIAIPVAATEIPPAPEPPEPVAPQPLSLRELDEFSIDDLIEAVAAGTVPVASLPDPDEEEEAAATAAAAEPRAPQTSGVFSRWLARLGRRGSGD